MRSVSVRQLCVGQTPTGEASKNKVEVRTIAFNFDQEASAYTVLAEKLKDLEIGVLGVLIVHIMCAHRQ
jgi:hypothetical protein